MLQVTKRKRVCDEAAKVNKRAALEFHCLQANHFQPEVAETFPYEGISMAVLSWLKEQPDRCQVCCLPGSPSPSLWVVCGIEGDYLLPGHHA